MTITLYTNCYTPELLSSMQPGFTPWDNTSNPEPILREFPVFLQVYEKLQNNVDAPRYWGVLSPKFEEKSGISGTEFYDWIKNNPTNADVYFINPKTIAESLYPNVVYHGERWHTNLASLMQRYINLFHPNVDLSSLYMDTNSFAMCNYFVGNSIFWKEYLNFVNTFLHHVSQNELDRKMMFSVSANYNLDHSVPYYSFVVERLFSVFLRLHPAIRAKSFSYTREQLNKKLQLPEPIIDELMALTAIKNAAISGKNPDLLPHWAWLRNRMTQQNPYILSLE